MNAIIISEMMLAPDMVMFELVYLKASKSIALIILHSNCFSIVVK